MTASTAVHSNAFNFMSYIQNGVDPRTGQYTLGINLPALRSYDLNGPELPLSLNFNPLNNDDSGYGKGWDLKLSQYTVATRILALSTGETFKVTGTGSEPSIKEKKIQSFRFFDDGVGADGVAQFRVVHKSGLVEHLRVEGNINYQVALPKFIDSAQGHRLTLDYIMHLDFPLLRSVREGSTVLLQVSRVGNQVHIDRHPGAGEGGAAWARYTLELDGQQVRRIVLPMQPEASWRLQYQDVLGIQCLKTVDSPTGSREELFYDDGGHQYPDGSRGAGAKLFAAGVDLPPRIARALAELEEQLGRNSGAQPKAPGPLPRVNRHVTHPGFEQLPIEVHYSYGLAGQLDNYNFLGHGAEGVVWDPSGLDNLYQATKAYLYGSTEKLMVAGQAVRTIQRTFNGYHLLIDQTTQQNSCVHSTVTQYPVNEGAPFDLQPAQCQLPSYVVNAWVHLVQGTRVAETEISEFDTSGNPVRNVSIEGIETLSTWYPAEGADGCPADPYGFVRHLRERTVVPADETYADAPVLVSRWRYATLPPVVRAESGPGDGPAPLDWMAAISEEEVQQAPDGEIAVRRTDSQYINNPIDLATHGRPERVDATLNGHKASTHYRYSRVGTQIANEPGLQTVEQLITHDGLHKEVTRIESLLTGNTLLDRDDNDIEIRTGYNALDQVIAETAAPGTPQEATRYYRYQLVDAWGEQAEQGVTDVKGIETRTRFDGLNRAIYEERQQESSSARAGEFVQTYAAAYDGYGQLVRETEFDWRLGDSPSLPGLKFTEVEFNWLADDALELTTTFEYDDWGQQCKATGPDGVLEHEYTDPSRRLSTAWRADMGKTLTTFNVFDKPTRVERQRSNGAFYSAQTNAYDGLGRLRRETDALTEQTTYAYDVFDRLTLNVLPDRARVVREFATHTDEDLPTSIRVDEKLLGAQFFDGLSRLTRSIVGNRNRSYDYAGSLSQPKTMHTPAGATIEYEYLPHLSDEPIARSVAGTGVAARYDLDPHNARLLKGSESAHELTRTYFSTGELQTEVRVEDGMRHEMAYVYSLQGRLLSYTDVLGNTQTHTYDLAGRLIGTVLGSTVSSLTYNDAGLNDTIHTHDATIGQQVNVALEYDDFGRETLRRFDLGGGLIQTLAQAYTRLDQMSSRKLSEGATVLREEEFVYDPRGHLLIYTAAGPEAPHDPAGKQIESQAFVSDHLDNHEVVITTFSGGRNTAYYTYSEVDPAQLVQIDNSHTDYASFNMTLNYDANGNLLQDEAGRSLSYDAFSRLVAVTPADGSAALSYGYDATDILSSAANERRFYRAGELANLVEQGQGRTIMRAGEVLLAEHQQSQP